ncbi:phosphatidylinositol 4-phosphatase [Nematocida parisii]|nr:phosphatidylinositol 4-phosphatase [Nematocida parisii]
MLGTHINYIQEKPEMVELTAVLSGKEGSSSEEGTLVRVIEKRHNKKAKRQSIGKSRGITVREKAKSISNSPLNILEESRSRQKTQFSGIFGEIDINDGTYLVYVKESRVVGEIKGEKVYEALDCGSICIDGLEDPMIKGVFTEFFKIPGMFFSKYNLGNAGSSVKENTDFIYNFIPLSKFRQNNPDASMFGIELIQGFFGQCALSGKVNLMCTLISRRSWRNAGTRYYARGSDPNGDAANTVETLLIAEGEEDNKPIQREFIQCRGSIPLSWEQKINLSYKPPIRMGSCDVSRHLFSKHLGVLQRRYGRYFFVTLLDIKGHEKELNSKFTNALKETGCKYLAVDYHKMVKSTEEKKQFKKSLKEILSNRCIIRTNCVDCLDRTNVVQSQLAKIRLVELLGLKEFSSNNDVLDIDDYLNESSIKKFGQLWNSNANMLSMQYTGTSALKNDLTEHGVRTIKGLIQDAISSGKRYVNNNFTDGRMQEIIEVITGVRQTLGNCIRGDRKIEIYVAIWAVIIYCLYRHSTSAGTAGLVCFILLFRSALFFCLSFPSPLTATKSRISEKPNASTL